MDNYEKLSPRNCPVALGWCCLCLVMPRWPHHPLWEPLQLTLCSQVPSELCGVDFEYISPSSRSTLYELGLMFLYVGLPMGGGGHVSRPLGLGTLRRNHSSRKPQRLSLPRVRPTMAHLAMFVAWGVQSGVGVDTCAQNHQQMPSGPRVPGGDLFLPRGVAAQGAVGQDWWTVGRLWSVDLPTVCWSWHMEATHAGWPRPGLLSDHCLLHGFSGKLQPIYNKAQGLFARKAKKKQKKTRKNHISRACHFSSSSLSQNPAQVLANVRPHAPSLTRSWRSRGFPWPQAPAVGVSILFSQGSLTPGPRLSLHLVK